MKNLLRTIRYRLIQGIFGRIAPELQLEGRILLLAPHPDDEVLGCGGLLSRLVHQGKEVDVCIISDGSASHHNCCDTPSDIIAAERKQLAYSAARIIGLPNTHIHFLNLLDGNIPSDFHLELSRKPDVVLVPHWGEGWPDHLAVREIGLRLGAPTYEYCVWMWYYNTWRIFSQKAYALRMSQEEHTTKRLAIEAYTRPTAPCGHPWSGQLPPLLLQACKTRTEIYWQVSP